MEILPKDLEQDVA